MIIRQVLQLLQPHDFVRPGGRRVLAYHRSAAAAATATTTAIGHWSHITSAGSDFPSATHGQPNCARAHAATAVFAPRSCSQIRLPSGSLVPSHLRDWLRPLCCQAPPGLRRFSQTDLVYLDAGVLSDIALELRRVGILSAWSRLVV